MVPSVPGVSTNRRPRCLHGAEPEDKHRFRRVGCKGLKLPAGTHTPSQAATFSLPRHGPSAVKRCDSFRDLLHNLSWAMATVKVPKLIRKELQPLIDNFCEAVFLFRLASEAGVKQLATCFEFF